MPLPTYQSSQQQAERYRDDIAKTAYEFWEDAGRPEGRDQEFWIKAEKRWWETFEQLPMSNTFGRSLIPVMKKLVAVGRVK